MTTNSNKPVWSAVVGSDLNTPPDTATTTAKPSKRPSGERRTGRRPFARSAATPYPPSVAGGRPDTATTPSRTVKGWRRIVARREPVVDGRQCLPLNKGFIRICDHCQRQYLALRPTSKYCSTRCRVAAARVRKGAGEK